MTARLALHAAAPLFVVTAALTAQTIPPTVKAAEDSIATKASSIYRLRRRPLLARS